MSLPAPFTLSVSDSGLKDCKIRLDITAPLSGKVAPLDQVANSIFSSGLLGAGVSISPTGHTVLSPFSGVILAISPTKEQLRIKSRQGLEVLIQIGINSHKMMSEGFKLRVRVGENVRAGQPLMEFDLRKLRLYATSPVCFVLVPILSRLKHIQGHYHSLMAGEDPCMTLFID
ncbi:PTS glucose transporter subunit IIA [Lacimicrobium sp. SS2-24]|uniref:PTS sugar transporter subunit IIA n=1 Tax=Lacimicrobium sp. SS2-24 TaxID=2005569 RepID=UPI000B4BEAA9|nr:PTS glucose transporter subunit IIA [Lacimicrobium sp. SS2-24]